MEVDEESDQTSDIYPNWMAAHVCLTNEFMEDETCHNLMSWLNLCFVKVTNEYKEHEIGQLIILHLLFIIYYIVLLHTDVSYSTSLSFEESVSMSHTSSAASVKAFMNLSCVLGCLLFG